MDGVIFNNALIPEEISGRLSKEDFARIFYTSDDSTACVSDGEIINAFTVAAENRFECQNTINLDRSGSADQSIYDPPRPGPCLAPPKRFFRSFWISIAKRLLAEDVAMPNK